MFSVRNYLNFCKYYLPKTQMYGCHALEIQVPSSLNSNCTKALNDISRGIKRPNILSALSVAKRKSTFGQGGEGVRGCVAGVPFRTHTQALL